MAEKNLTAMLYKKDDLRMVDRPIPEPRHGQVQLEMRQVGVCGSDVHFWTEGGIGDFMVRSPMALGHESSGVVTKLGPGVTSLEVGDRVAIEPAWACRMCHYCKSGRYNLCPEVKCCATPPTDGNLSRFYVHEADFCHKLPDNVSLDEGALAEPLSVGVHATNRAGMKLGDTVLVCGAGPIGLTNLLVAKARGASVVCITDHNQPKLDLAKTLGADHAIRVTRTCKDPTVTATAVEAALGDKYNVSIECTGAADSVNAAIHATKNGGVVVLVGCGPRVAEIPVSDVLWKEVDIRGAFRYANCYPTALNMIASGKVNVNPLVTHRFKLEDSIKAFEAAKRGDGIKIMIDCGHER